MLYHIIRPERRPEEADARSSLTMDDVVDRFFESGAFGPKPDPGPTPGRIGECLGLAEIDPDGSVVRMGDADPATADTRAEVGIDLCDGCAILGEAVAAKALYVLLTGVVIPRPHVPDECLDAIAIDPSESNPLRCCPGCGHVMNGNVAIRRPAAGRPHADTCCSGMQTAVAKGTVRLSGIGSFMTGRLVSAVTAERLRFEHCGWCGMWLQVLHHARIVAKSQPAFFETWDRKHSRYLD